ncbi:S-layer homology domain-containing protein, partial [Metabacillus litoralis]
MKSYFTKSLFLTGFILLFSFNSVSASTDIEGSYAKDAILELVEKGIISGDANGDFNVTGKITRQDFASVLAKSLELDSSNSSVTATFSDVPVDHYSYAYVEAAVKAGLISGTGEGNFGFNTNLTREDMATIFVKALGADAVGYGDKLTSADQDRILEWKRDSEAYAV